MHRQMPTFSQRHFRFRCYWTPSTSVRLASIQDSASGLTLTVTAIILWNTRYLERAVAIPRHTEDIPHHLLAHLSPLGWEHFNLTGDYILLAANGLSENTDGLQDLRPPPHAFRKAK